MDTAQRQWDVGWRSLSEVPDKANKYNRQTRVRETGQSTKQVNNAEQTLRRDCNLKGESRRRQAGQIQRSFGGLGKFESCSAVCFLMEGMNLHCLWLSAMFGMRLWKVTESLPTLEIRSPCRSRLTNLCRPQDSQPCDTSAPLLGWISYDTPPLCSASTRKLSDSTQSTGGLWFCWDWWHCWKSNCACSAEGSDRTRPSRNHSASRALFTIRWPSGSYFHRLIVQTSSLKVNSDAGRLYSLCHSEKLNFSFFKDKSLLQWLVWDAMILLSSRSMLRWFLLQWSLSKAIESACCLMTPQLHVRWWFWGKMESRSKLSKQVATLPLYSRESNSPEFSSHHVIEIRGLTTISKHKSICRQFTWINGHAAGLTACKIDIHYIHV